jgi:hypothetical protein
MMYLFLFWDQGVSGAARLWHKGEHPLPRQHKHYLVEEYG